MRPTPRRRALVCAPLPPEYDREGGSRRLYDFIDFLLAAGWSVTFVCESAGQGTRYLRMLRQRGVNTWVGFGKETEAVIATGGFDLAILAFWHVAHARAGLVRKLSPRTRILVESVDLHWLRNARRVLGRPGGDECRLDETFANEMIGELNAYAEADGVLTVSEKEARLVDDVLGRPAFAAAVPDCESIEASPLGFEQRRGILFLGNFRHPPNTDAVAFLCRDIVPRIPEALLVEHPLLIVGNALGEEIERLAAGHPGVRTVGWVPAVEPYLHRARVAVVPLRYGAGTKRKLLQALMAGTPSVSTAIGLEGLDFEPGTHVLEADTAAAFAAAVVRLLEDELLWRRLSKAGRKRVLESHGREHARRAFLATVDAMLARTPRGRAESQEERAARSRRETEVERVRLAAARALPAHARVLVISRGDPELLRLGDRATGHFPQAADGAWTGFHPPDSEDALRRLAELRRGHDFLLIPGTASWWLDHYAAFARHLNERCTRIWYDASCAIYDLRSGAGTVAENQAAVRGERETPKRRSRAG
jgi:glycosyltransferase involved in cell wall biosynthesis